MHPIIGITADHADNQLGQPITELAEAYSRAISEAGAAPVLIPAVLGAAARQDLFAHLDGILFSGGGDIHPRHYASGYAGRLVSVHAARDELELDLLRMAIARPRPFLGICRGCQLLNVGLGGTLYPDLPTEPGGPVKHDMAGSERAVLVHDVTIEAGSRLAGILGQSVIAVNSHHHQGLNSIASNLRVAGRASDGLVEAIELPDHPFALAVQWHPEWLTHQHWTRALFEHFVAAAASQQ
ncbi:MAG: gamma-glutamyl-gamma-aminobutyrate hydrolase family protein [Chloroflexota bacterium]